MKRTLLTTLAVGTIAVFAFAGLTTSQEAPPPAPIQQPDDGIPDGVEIQTRGPIHEAFIQPVNQQPEPPAIIQKEPPPPIPEDPPADMLDNPDAQFIPGYWAWDAAINDFLWVSGVQRIPPQGRVYVPGYWEHTPDGWRWIAGFWSDPRQNDMPYTPEPPAPLDEQYFPPPDDNSIYIPGNWIYRGDRFVWRGGYYSQGRLGAVWCPSHYHWTPNGYLFVDGGWDLPYDQRGIAYAPVCFNRPLWNNPGWRYRPNFAINFGIFFDSAFVRGGGYYFGNYYDQRYARLGYNPWFNGRGRYDPAFAYYGWQNQRNNPNWMQGVQQQYAGRSAGRLGVPPATFAQQAAFVRANNAPVVAPATQLKSPQVRLAKATQQQVDTQRNAIERTREIAANRQQLERTASKQGVVGNPARPAEVRTLRLPTILEKGPQATNNNPDPVQRPFEFKQKNEPKNVTTLPKTEPRNESPGKINPFVPKNVNPQPQPAPKVEIRNTPPLVIPPEPKKVNPQPQPAPKNVNPQPQPAPKVEIRNTPPLVIPPEPKKVIPQPKNDAPAKNNPFVPKNVNPQPQPAPKVEIRNTPPPIVNPQPQPAPKNVNPQPQPAPKVEIRNTPPPIVNPPAPKINPQPQPAPKIVQPPPQPAPRVNPQPQPQPKIVQPPPQPAPRVNPQPQPAPKIVQPPPQPAPRVNPQPQPAPRIVQPPPQPAPRVNPPAPAPKASAPPPPRVQSPPPAPPRVQSAPPAPRPSAPAPKSSPPPRKK